MNITFVLNQLSCYVNALFCCVIVTRSVHTLCFTHVARGLCMAVVMWKWCKRHAVRQRPRNMTLKYAGFCAVWTGQRQNHAWVV